MGLGFGFFPEGDCRTGFAIENTSGKGFNEAYPLDIVRLRQFFFGTSFKDHGLVLKVAPIFGLDVLLPFQNLSFRHTAIAYHTGMLGQLDSNQ